jgi:hypothetical protein
LVIFPDDASQIQSILSSTTASSFQCTFTHIDRILRNGSTNN